eukprot:scaffold280629_cov36-Tisochrysis_lutea.AAC.1
MGGQGGSGRGDAAGNELLRLGTGVHSRCKCKDPLAWECTPRDGEGGRVARQAENLEVGGAWRGVRVSHVGVGRL